MTFKRSVVAFLLLLLVDVATAVPCCSQKYKECDITWCNGSQSACENCGDPSVIWLTELPDQSCTERWQWCSATADCCPGLACENNNCRLVPATPSPTTAAPSASMAPTSFPTVSSAPTVSAAPTRLLSTFQCQTTGEASWTASKRLDQITNVVSASNPYMLSVIASGGAAGNGDVVSEGQGYGLLISALALVSMDSSDSNYAEAKDRFEGYFNGWKKMCENTKNDRPSNACQSTFYCDGGSLPCLPGWKHQGDLSSQVETGAAPDGDEDAIVGMIIAAKAVENDSTLPSWYGDVVDWADRSSTQFMQDNTVLSNSGNHRLIKLGSCWGGWDGQGNNPSYHGPGHYRMMRDFQASITSRSYTLPYAVTEWNKVIDTSYKFFETTQCSDTGLVPNWALVQESSPTTLAKQSGTFSGSGTPQYEFGSEASRTMWRVAFDAAAYPDESLSQAGPFLEPLHSKLVQYFVPFSFGFNSLETCSPLVNSIHSGWQDNGFIFGPVYSSLIGSIDESAFGNSFEQQDMVDTACQEMAGKLLTESSYFPLCWLIISQLTLNGEVARAGALIHGGSTAPPAPPTTPSSPSPSIAPTPAPTDATPPPSSLSATPFPTPTISPTPASTPPAAESSVTFCCSWNMNTCPQTSAWCDFSQSRCECNCSGNWINPVANQGCLGFWQQCQNDSDCCGSATCEGGDYKQCQKGPNPCPS